MSTKNLSGASSMVKSLKRSPGRINTWWSRMFARLPSACSPRSMTVEYPTSCRLAEGGSTLNERKQIGKDVLCV